MNKNIQQKNTARGITLLITLLTMGVLLSIAASLMFVTLKQYQLSGIVYSSEVAFQAATAGVECAIFHDFESNAFDVPGDGSNQSGNSNIDCFNVNDTADAIAASGGEQLFRFSWTGTSGVESCTDISVYKFYDDGTDGDSTGPQVVVDGVNMKAPGGGAANECPEGSECTVVQSRGYNVPCGDISSSRRVVEREYTQVY